MNSDIKRIFELLDNQHKINKTQLESNEKQMNINKALSDAIDRIQNQLIDMMERELENATS